MKRKVCAVMALFGLSAATAAAEDVYKCVGSDGRLSYQARPCTQGQAQSTVTIRKAPPPPPPAKGAASQEQIQSSLDFMKHSAPPVAPPSAPPAAEAPAVPKSYKCTADSGAVFYLHSKCPSFVSIQRGRDYSYTTGVKGVEITREEACAQIYKVTSSARDGSKLDDRVSTYDKNLGRDSHCKGY